MAENKRPLPVPTPETAHFWEGAKAGELRLQRCDACRYVYFPPRPFCPKCASRKVSVFKASGRAKLHSYVINHRPLPGFTAPHSIAVVELAEGPRMMTNIVGCPQTPEALQLDMPVEVVFEKQTDEIALPLFKPVGK
ncbi:MAG TPA: Zn-ribbon domain-containing OB-fold protein [Candidatus Binataceae bacterium]|nr:Zn-ribbon domain-containing OB-fold protein [Candidatus Binataceae bacterium]